MYCIHIKRLQRFILYLTFILRQLTQNTNTKLLVVTRQVQFNVTNWNFVKSFNLYCVYVIFTAFMLCCFVRIQ